MPAPRHYPLATAAPSRRQGVAMGIVLVMGCWICTIFYFFGRKILALYDVLVSLLTHFIPLGPILLIVLIVALIVVAASHRKPVDLNVER
jgi:hypothetical protein